MFLGGGDDGSGVNLGSKLKNVHANSRVVHVKGRFSWKNLLKALRDHHLCLIGWCGKS